MLGMTVAASKPTGGDVSKLKFPETRSSSNTRSAKELENFIWDVEQYFKTSQIVETTSSTLLLCICPVMLNFGGGPGIWMMKVSVDQGLILGPN